MVSTTEHVSKKFDAELDSLRRALPECLDSVGRDVARNVAENLARLNQPVALMAASVMPW